MTGERVSDLLGGERGATHGVRHSRGKHTKMNRITRRTLLAASAAPLAGSLLAQHRARAEEAYVLGTLFPMAGANAEYGTIFTAGAAMAVKHVTADKMLSRPLLLRPEDSEGTPQGGAVGMNKLVNVDHALYVLVGFTGVSKAAAPIGTRAKVVMVNGGGVGPDLAGLSPYYWNVIPLVPDEIKVLVPFLLAHQLRRVALIYVNDPFGNGLYKALKTDLTAAGGEIVAADTISPTDQQFSAIAARIRTLAPDAVYFASYGAQQAQIIKQLRDAGIGQPLLTYSGAAIPSVRNLAEAEGLILTAQAADWTLDDPITKRFVTDWRAQYGSDPTPYNQNYYNAVRLFALLAQQLEKAGKPVGGDTLRAALLATRRFALVGGEGVFDDLGDISMKIVVNTLKGGKLVPTG